MNAIPYTGPEQTRPPMAVSPAAQRAPQEFASLAALAREDDPQPQQDLVLVAQRLVSHTFFGALLKQMRQSPFRSEMFSGGRGGEAFSSLYDQHLADRMARGAGSKLVNSIVRRHQRAAAYHRQSRVSQGSFNHEVSHVTADLRG
jgi:Rod binding domain-containing protein